MDWPRSCSQGWTRSDWSLKVSKVERPRRSDGWVESSCQALRLDPANQVLVGAGDNMLEHPRGSSM